MTKKQRREEVRGALDTLGLRVVSKGPGWSVIYLHRLDVLLADIHKRLDGTWSIGAGSDAPATAWNAVEATKSGWFKTSRAAVEAFIDALVRELT